jgi:hypothetical protein
MYREASAIGEKDLGFRKRRSGQERIEKKRSGRNAQLKCFSFGNDAFGSPKVEIGKPAIMDKNNEYAGKQEPRST